MLVILATFLAFAAASPLPDHPLTPPNYAPAPNSYGPILPPVYSYEYGVHDPHYGPVFSAKESRDNYDIAGEYRVNLPDGRVQVVSYTANTDGYFADVTYEGKATSPEAPAYKPAPKPVYKSAPAPAYKPRIYTFKTIVSEEPTAKAEKTDI